MLLEKELLPIVRDYKYWDQMAKEAEKQMKKLKPILIAELDARELESLMVDVFTLQYPTINQNKFDQTLFKDENPDLYESYKRPSSYKKFHIA
jgi:predicted phage-related endonuclease